MGTRGLVYVRCRGRYFIYYNQFDSYPEGLGQAIVQRIPVDPEGYQKWLQFMRDTWSRLCQEFEERLLPVDVKLGQEDVEIPTSEVYSKSYLAIDDRLERAPTLAMSPKHLNDLFIEFTYTLDLDREIFSVDDGAHFRLSKIPRGEYWIQYTDIDRKGRRILAPNTPEEIIAKVEWEPDFGEEMPTLPENFQVKTVYPKIFTEFPGAARQELLYLIFKSVRDTYRELLDRYIVSWKPDGFAFREMAFALISIAAGEISLECPRVLDRSRSNEGYFLIPDAKLQPRQQKLLPTFMNEAHIPGIEPGSAPKATVFWFNNVLVYLTSRLDLRHVEEASVAEVVQSGLKQGVKYFSALVFSILDLVLLHVNEEKDGTVTVKRTYLLNLFQFTDENSRYAYGPRTRFPDCFPSRNEFHLRDLASKDDNSEDGASRDGYSKGENSKDAGLQDDESDSKDDDMEDAGSKATASNSDDHGDSGDGHSRDGDPNDTESKEGDSKNARAKTKEPKATTEALLSRMEHIAFYALVQFFDNAAKQSLLGQKSTRLPNEVLTSIMQSSNVYTYHQLAKVSSGCREMANSRFRLNDNYVVIGWKQYDDGYRLVIEDTQSGKRFQVSETGSYNVFGDRRQFNKNEMDMNPVIGITDVNRPSIMDLVTICFAPMSPRDPICERESRHPRQVQFYWTTDPRAHDDSKVLKLPDYVYSGHVEEAWGRYLDAKLKGKGVGHLSATRAASYRCLLLPRYRELNSDAILFNNKIRAIVRHARDESSDEWEKTKGYAVHELAHSEVTRHGKQHHGDPSRGCFTIVAFGSRFKLFYYVFYNSNPEPLTPSTNNPYSEKIAANVTNCNPGGRLIPLIVDAASPEAKILDLRDNDGQAAMGHWLDVMKGTRFQENKFYEPITDEYIPIPDPEEGKENDTQETGDDTDDGWGAW